MKKYVMFGSVWLCLLMSLMTITSKAEITYEIRYDAKTTQTYALKEEVQEAYTKLVHGVHQESFVQMVMYNLEVFEFEDEIKAEWNNNRLLITQGDGLGTTVRGELVANSVCVPEVKPKSFLEELFNFS